MRPCLSVLAAAALALFGAGGALAQELTVEAKSLGSAPATAKPAGRKDAAKPPAKGAGKVENRRFGELEGWSPGKSPPRKEDKTPSSSETATPLSLSPNGNMSVGFPF